MQICYFGSYEKDYPGNMIIIVRFEKSGVEVIDYHRPVWELSSDKSYS